MAKNFYVKICEWLYIKWRWYTRHQNRKCSKCDHYHYDMDCGEFKCLKGRRKESCRSFKRLVEEDYKNVEL